MKTIIICCWLLVAGYWNVQPSGNLTITISNISQIEGELYVAIYDHPDKYMDIEQAAFRKIVPVNDKVETLVFEGIPEGEYAIAIFQDLNGNGELDSRGMGVPKEPFGFSNNARGKMGPPKYKTTKFNFSGEMEISIKLVNNAQE